MQIQLSQKELDLINDALKHEDICAKKYSAYSNQLQDAELKGLFKQLQTREEQHINTLNQLKNGQMPNLQQSVTIS